MEKPNSVYVRGMAVNAVDCDVYYEVIAIFGCRRSCLLERVDDLEVASAIAREGLDKPFRVGSLLRVKGGVKDG